MEIITVDMHQILGDRALYDTKLEYLKYVAGIDVDVFTFFTNENVDIGSASLKLNVFVREGELPEGVSCEEVAETAGVALGEWFGDFRSMIEEIKAIKGPLDS